MDVIGAFLRAIPSAATSPLALIAYLATLVAWVVVTRRVHRFRELMKHIKDLPERDRLPAIKAELGVVDVPKGLTGEQYLRKRIHTFLFVGGLVLCAAISIVGLKAAFDVYQQMIRADNLTSELLSPPTSDYMSAVNTLSNGRQMIDEAVTEIQPALTNSELADTVDQLVQQGLTASEIAERLAESAGTARLRQTNEVLARAAGRLNGLYSELEKCFRQVRCRSGFDVATLCEALMAIQGFTDAINLVAQRIPGINYDSSGTIQMLGGGSLDVAFSAIRAGNITYLLSAACTSR